MAVSVELRFDVRTEEAIRRTWDSLADAGIARALRDGGMTPHVTLGACSSLANPEALDALLAELAGKTSALSLAFHHIGVFFGDEGVVFAGVAPTESLLAIHHAFWNGFKELAIEPRNYYRPGSWVPHATLAIRANGREREQALTFLHRSREFPLIGRATRLVLAESANAKPKRVWTLDESLAREGE